MGGMGEGGRVSGSRELEEFGFGRLVGWLDGWKREIFPLGFFSCVHYTRPRRSHDESSPMARLFFFSAASLSLSSTDAHGKKREE